MAPIIGPAPYWYRAKLTRLIDGDTVVLEVDVGFTWQWTARVRLADINAPEMTTPEGQAAKAFALGWFSAHPELLIHTRRDANDDYGRLIATIYAADHLDDTASLNQIMLDNGQAVPWPAPKKGPSV